MGRKYVIDHFPVVCWVTWRLNGSEAEGELVLIQTSLPLLCKSRCFNETRCIYTAKAEVCTASLPFKGQVTEYTTVKWSIRVLDIRIYTTYFFVY